MGAVSRETTACILADRTLSQVWVMIAGARLAYTVTGHLRPGGFAQDADALRRRRPPTGYQAVPVRELIAAGATTIHPSSSPPRLPRSLRTYISNPSKEHP